MTSWTNRHEALLCTAYREEADCYAQALRLAEELPAALGPGGSSPEKLQKILDCFDRVAAIEGRINETKKTWRSGAPGPGPELKTVLDHITQLIEHLQSRMSDVEKQASAQKELLEPKLDASIRGQRMQRAYERSRAL